MVEPRDLPSDPDFARRVEQAEIGPWLDIEPVLDGSRMLERRTIEGVLLVLDREKDWPHNRLFSLGFPRPATPELISRILDVAEQSGVEGLETDISPVARPGTLSRLLTQAGFVQTERNVVVARHTEGMPEPDGYFRIRTADRRDTDAIVDLMASVIGGAVDWLRLLAGQVQRDPWRFYLATEAGEPCGVAATHTTDDVAWLGPVWVRNESRNRGTQAALIAYAVRALAAEGTPWVTASYPASVSGRTRNFERLGFSMVYQRGHFVWKAGAG